MQLRAAHKPALPRPEPEAQQKVMLSAEEHAQALLALRRELAELQELYPLATGKPAEEPQQALHEEQAHLLSAQADAYTELLADKDRQL